MAIKIIATAAFGLIGLLALLALLIPLAKLAILYALTTNGTGTPLLIFFVLILGASAALIQVLWHAPKGGRA